MKKLFSFLLAMILITGSTAVAFAEQDYNLIKNVEGGRIKGRMSTDGIIAEFKGIPYAAPPVGDLRWREPQDVIPWDDVRECFDFSASAMQEEQKASEEYTEEFIVDTSKGYSEDCLYLNVWTKADNNSDKPVIVYIHGGGFLAGGASCDVYSGEDIARKDVVFVSINYRLGVFGFLGLKELSEESPLGVSGNYALLDMIKALTWVQNNISQFGGNPGNITVMGQSAGACATEVLTISPLAKGLFHRAVILSYPQTGNTYASLGQREMYGKLKTGSKSLSELRQEDAESVLTNYGSGVWFPCIDGKIIPCSTLEAYKQGIQNDMPVLMCTVDDGDKLFGVGFDLLSTVFNMVKSKPGFINRMIILPKLIVEFMKYYPVAKTGDIVKDRLFAAEYFTAKAKNVHGKTDTFIAHFSYNMPGGINKSFHTSDVPYWLNHLSAARSGAWTRTDELLADIMSDYLVNFAESGNPDGTAVPAWKSCGDSFNMQVFNSDGTVTSDTFISKPFWDLYGELRYGL